MNQYVLQELPIKRLQQQQEDNGGQQAECKSCGEQAPVVAWCEDCDAMICQQCAALHEKLASLRRHHVVEKPKEDRKDETTTSLEKQDTYSTCLRHSDEKLKYLCTTCSELVCPECLLFDHKDHQFSLVEEARHSLETKMEELASLAVTKKQEFGCYLERVNEAEGKALKYSELMKTRVNNVFDGIVASVEAQRNEALQSVSEEVKEIWAQKEMVEVSLAQLDSFTRFDDHTYKCTTDARFAAMATQGIKLMERLKDNYGDESTFNQKMVGIMSLTCVESPLRVPLDNLFVLGKVSLEFSPAPCSTIECPHSGIEQISLIVSLIVGGHPVVSTIKRERCNFLVSAYIEPYINVNNEPAEDEQVQAEPIGQLQAEPTEPIGQQQAEPTEPIGQLQAEPTEPIEPIGQLQAEPTEPIRQQQADPTEPIGQQQAKPTEPIGQQQAEPTEPIGQQQAEPTEPIGQQQADPTGQQQADPTEPTAISSIDGVGNVALKLISTDEDIFKEAVDENAVKCSSTTELLDESDKLAWKVTVNALCLPDYQTLVVRYQLSGDIASETAEVTYKF